MWLSITELCTVNILSYPSSFTTLCSFVQLGGNLVLMKNCFQLVMLLQHSWKQETCDFYTLLILGAKCLLSSTQENNSYCASDEQHMTLSSALFICWCLLKSTSLLCLLSKEVKWWSDSSKDRRKALSAKYYMHYIHANTDCILQLLISGVSMKEQQSRRLWEMLLKSRRTWEKQECMQVDWRKKRVNSTFNKGTQSKSIWDVY